MVNLQKKIKVIGVVPVVNRIEGSEEEGKIVGTAKLEKYPNGNIIACVDMSGKTADILRRGFSLGDVSIVEKEEAQK